MKEQKVCINLWLVEAIILDLLEEINAIVTENITSESKKLIELLSKISEITGVNMTKVFYFILFIIITRD